MTPAHYTSGGLAPHPPVPAEGHTGPGDREVPTDRAASTLAVALPCLEPCLNAAGRPKAAQLLCVVARNPLWTQRPRGAESAHGLRCWLTVSPLSPRARSPAFLARGFPVPRKYLDTTQARASTRSFLVTPGGLGTPYCSSRRHLGPPPDGGSTAHTLEGLNPPDLSVAPHPPAT